MTLRKADIPEVPNWLSIPGDNTDSFFYQQLAEFAGQRLSGSQNIVVSGQFIFSGGSFSVLTFNSKPKVLISICTANIGTGAPYCRMWFDDWIVSGLSYNTVGPLHQVSIVPGTGLNVARTDNGDGTWTLDPNAWGFTNSTTDPDFYVIFLQT